MKPWKIILVVLAGFLTFVGGLVAIIFYATSGITETSDEFFAAARSGQYQSAYELTTRQLRAETSPEQLQSFLESNGLDKVTETSWRSRSINNDQGRLEGTATTEDGGTIPLAVEMIKESDGWRISLIKPAESGLKGAGAAADDPAATQAEAQAENPD
ncbi:MAG: hypothetical protein R3E18_09610 [Sphingomonadaceae bacterium]|nr:hypothetical protein [Sphingomonadaceae bacterium]